MAKIARVCHTVDAELIGRVRQLARSERRNRSNMVEVLLREAITARSASVPRSPSVERESLPRKARSA